MTSVDEEAMTHSVPKEATDNDGAVDRSGEANESEGSVVDSAPGTDGDVDLVIPVEMNEWGYVITDASVPVGSTVRFEFVNVGIVEHEAMFGTMHQQEEFAEDGHGDHGEADHHGTIEAVTLDPGETGSLVVEFDETGEILIGCHLPGHWEAGMVTTLAII